MALKKEQQSCAEGAVKTAKKNIAVNFEEMAALRIVERRLAETSRTGEEGFAIKTQRLVIHQRIEQKIQERTALYQKQQMLVQRSRVELEEMDALNIKLSEEAAHRDEELAALRIKQTTNTGYIDQKFEERMALQMDQQTLAEETVRIVKDRRALEIEHERVPQPILEDLEEQATLDIEQGKPVEDAERRLWVWLDIMIGG